MAHKGDVTSGTRTAAPAEKKELPAVSAASNQILGSSLQRLRLTEHERSQRIADLAYQKASQRGFEPGAEWDDWLAAELEVDARIAAEGADVQEPL